MKGKESTLSEVIKKSKDTLWLKAAREKIKKRAYSNSTRASKDTKRKKIQEIMDSLKIQREGDGINQDEIYIFTVAAVLGEANLKSRDQYLAEVKLMQLEIGLAWSDSLER